MSLRNSATILLVEDDPTIMEGVSELLRMDDKVGYDIDVITAENGAVALERMAGVQPDLIISDIMMPKLDGYEMLKLVRDNDAWVGIPVIFMTARGEKEDIHKGRLHGVQDYVTKPFDTHVFIDLVRSHLDRTFSLRLTHQAQLQQHVSDVMKIVNHEVRTPLTYITAYYELLSSSSYRYADATSWHEYLRGIQSGCIRLGRLIDDFMTLLDVRSGSTAKQHSQRLMTIDNPAEIFRSAIHACEVWGRLECAESHQPQSGDPTLYFHIDVPESLPSILGDPEGLRDAVDRLLSNAVKFTCRQEVGDRHVYFSVDTDEKCIYVRVRDTGIGFPDTVRDRIFEALYQHNRVHLEQQGAGAGLTIAREHTRLHGGTVTASSKEETGALFTLALPLIYGDVSATAATDSDEAREATILVVEDDLHHRRGLCDILELVQERYVFNVLSAANGLEGLQVLEAHRPDLIISDVSMEPINGYEFLERVRDNPNWIQIPVIFLTALSDPRNVIQGKTSGVEEYFTKPYKSEELIDIVMAQLDRLFQVQDIYRQDFESIRQTILDIVQPTIKEALSDVNRYSEQVGERIDEGDPSAATAEDDPQGEDLQELLRDINNRNQELQHYVNDFIDLAALRTGARRRDFHKHMGTIYGLGSLIRDRIYDRRPTAEAAGITVELALAEPLPPVEGLVDWLMECVERLFTVGERTVRQGVGDLMTITSRADEAWITLQITCNGYGLKPDEETRLRSFFEGSSEHVLDVTGAGLRDHVYRRPRKTPWRHFQLRHRA